MVVPNNHWFPTKNDHFGVFWGYRHLRKHPYRDYIGSWYSRTLSCGIKVQFFQKFWVYRGLSRELYGPLLYTVDYNKA